MTKTALVLTATLALLAGPAFADDSASGSAASKAVDASAPPAADQPTSATAIPPPPAGKGQVIFYRPWNYFGAADWIKIRENGAELGKMYGGHYFIQVTDPGVHKYTVAMETTDTLKLQVDPGETYYVAAQVHMGVVLYRFNLAPVDEATFDKALKHLSPIKATGQGEEPAPSAAPAP